MGLVSPGAASNRLFLPNTAYLRGSERLAECSNGVKQGLFGRFPGMLYGSRGHAFTIEVLHKEVARSSFRHRHKPWSTGICDVQIGLLFERLQSVGISRRCISGELIHEFGMQFEGRF